MLPATLKAPLEPFSSGAYLRLDRPKPTYLSAFFPLLFPKKLKLDNARVESILCLCNGV